jgi:CRISPR-associated protein Csb2
MQAATLITPTQSALPLTEFTVVRYALEPSRSVSVREALPFAEQVRRALISHRVETSHSEAIVGKTVDGVPLAGHAHAHYLATDEDGDGFLDHVTINTPCGFDIGDLEALKAIRSVSRFDRTWRIRTLLIGVGQSVSFDADLFGISRRWRSVTPFSLPRFPNRGGGKPPRPRDLPEGQLVRELKNRGLPEPVSIKRIEGYQGEGRPLVRWLEFHTTRYNGTKGNGLAGFEIEFAEPVRGPIALGFACHFGLGLFLPC